MSFSQEIKELYLRRNLGLRVERATAVLPQTANAPIFNILTGRVMLTLLVGQITVVMGAVANLTRLLAVPTGATQTFLCIATDTANYAAGDLLSINGDFGLPLEPAATGGAVEGMVVPVILRPGTLDLDCAGNNTGSVRWTLCYVPIDNGAAVTAA